MQTHPPNTHTHLSSLFFCTTSLSPTQVRHLTVSRCNSWNAGRKRIPSSPLCKRRRPCSSSVALFAPWTRGADSATVGLATTGLYWTLLQLLPLARFVFLYRWFSKLALSGHNETSFTYVLQVSALNTFCTSNSAIAIGRIVYCITVSYKVCFYCLTLSFYKED